MLIELLSTQRAILNHMKNIYLLKDLASVTGHSTHTLKYYLRIGLLSEIGRGPETNFRYFDDSSVAVLQRIRSLRKEGYSLESIRQLLNGNIRGKTRP